MPEKKTISFSMTLDEFELIRIAGITKGLKPSGFCKMATFTYLTKSPPKGVLAKLARQDAEKP